METNTNMEALTTSLAPILNPFELEIPSDINELISGTHETVHITIDQVGKSTDKVEIPVRYTEAIEAIEEAIFEECTDPLRLRLLQKIYSIMQS